MDNIKLNGIPTKIKKRNYTLVLYSVCLKVFLVKNYKIQLGVMLFLLVDISFYISQYHFLQLLRTSYNIYLKKDFCHRFSLFNGFLQTLPLP